MSDIITDIQTNIAWLNANAKSQNISKLSIALSKLSVQCFYFCEIVADAYDLQQQTEDDYKNAKASFIKESTEGVTKASATVEADPGVAELKKLMTNASNIHHRYKLYAGAFDTIMDNFRQRVSVAKTLEAKNI